MRADRQTYRHADRNTSHPSRVRRNDSNKPVKLICNFPLILSSCFITFSVIGAYIQTRFIVVHLCSYNSFVIGALKCLMMMMMMLTYFVSCLTDLSRHVFLIASAQRLFSQRLVGYRVVDGSNKCGRWIIGVLSERTNVRAIPFPLRADGIIWGKENLQTIPDPDRFFLRKLTGSASPGHHLVEARCTCPPLYIPWRRRCLWMSFGLETKAKVNTRWHIINSSNAAQHNTAADTTVLYNVNYTERKMLVFSSI